MGFDEELHGTITGSWEYTTHFTNSKVLLGPRGRPASRNSLQLQIFTRSVYGIMGPTGHLLNCWLYGGYNHSYYILDVTIVLL